MDTKPVTVGIIGLGEIGELHARVILGDRYRRPPEKRAKKMDLVGTGRRLARTLLGRGRPARPKEPDPGVEDIEIGAVSDLDERRLALVKENAGIRDGYTDYKKLLARSDIEAVLVDTPPASHPEITIAAACAGKHVFCEKPMAMSSADCEKMIEATQKAGVVLQIGYVLRASSERGRIRDAILSGQIGRPVFFQYIMSPRGGSPQRWVFDERLGGGPLWEYSHGLDFVRHIFGDPEVVFGIGGRYKPEKTSAVDTLAVCLSFASGDKVLFADSYALRGFGWDIRGCRPHRLQIDVMGPKGFIQFPDKDLSQKLTICTYEDSQDRVEKIPWKSTWGANGYKEELRQFADSVRSGKPPSVPGEEGLRTVQLLETVMHSMATGSVCRFADRLPSSGPLRRPQGLAHP
ncbi:MAG TPA: Gfo/Idh/MocA family oxidoreductase [Candidatus Acidoferrales bacterium]|nr:Gfo/Idh/MocA family oxidoreductase [Candidatus Acidoferrales bacterium]